MQKNLPGIDSLWIKQRKIRFCGLVSGHEQKLDKQKREKLKQPRESNILPICRDAATGAIVEFWLAVSSPT